jgi:putative spermidine/putrescine transport system substrate-binding protein
MFAPTRRNVLTAMAGIAGTSILHMPAFAQATRELVVTVYGGVWEKFWRDALIPAFTKASNAQVKLDVGFGRTFTANMRAAGLNATPPYSMIMMNEVFAQVLRQEGYFERFDLAKVPNYADLHPIARTGNGDAAIGMISPIGLGYRTDLVRRPPKGWKDLWTNPEFKGRTGLYNIVNSAGKMMVQLTSKMYGKDIYDIDVGFKKLAELGKVLQTDFNMSTMMASGEIVIAPYDFGEIARLRAQGLPVDCIIPEEGMMLWDQTFSVTKNAPTRDLAYEYINFILSPEAQLLLMREFFVSPVNAKVTVPADLVRDVPVAGADMMKQFVAFDWEWVNKNNEELTKQWNAVVGK